jgi:aspartate aminotransferase
MISQEMLALGTKRSVIREIFEYGTRRKAQIGAENVFDFSLGNPSVPAPCVVTDALKNLIDTIPAEKLHAYTTAAGDMGVRTAIADHLNATYGANADPAKIYLTVGAAASLTISLTAITCQGDEVVVITPFCPEYSVFIRQAGGVPVTVACPAPDFQPDPQAVAAAITEKTKAIIINSPNNPSGVVFSEDSIKALCDVLEAKQKEYGHPIYLIADEPYRELVYDDVAVPYLTRYYDNTLVCYSFSKSLSLPGERIGYILVSSTAQDGDNLYFAVCGAGRSLGFVCAPSLFQYLLPACLGQTSDVSIYKKNRDTLYDNLTQMGYTLSKPQGAFYLFMKSPLADTEAFCEMAKKYELLIVPGEDFGVKDYVRISYCVSEEMIARSLPAFKALAEELNLGK